MCCDKIRASLSIQKHDSSDLDQITLIRILVFGPGMFLQIEKSKFSFFSHFWKDTLFRNVVIIHKRMLVELVQMKIL